MKTRIIAALLALCLLCVCVPAAFAATVDTALPDTDAPCSLTIHKIDLTAALENGVGSFVSTGKADDAAAAALAPYAIEGVEFTYVRVAQLVSCTEATDSGFTARSLYRFETLARTTALLAALGLDTPYRTGDGWADYTPEAVQAALAAQLAANGTAVKNALEAFAKTYGTPMPLTDAAGKTEAKELQTGLYLLVESKVPEQVVQTTDPWLVQLPMTTVDGADWNYDVVVYPKNATGDPTLEKTLRESKADGDKNDSGIADGYAHTATASGGDTVQYQILSTLPVITSDATALTAYTFRDTLDKGLAYKGGVTLTFYTDALCTAQAAQWAEGDGHFTVTRSDGGMTIAMSADGLAAINGGTAVHGEGSTQRGFSGCTLRITYDCTVTADAVLGGTGNNNSVTLTWQRTNTDRYDTLASCAHLYTYGLKVAKQFSGEGDPTKVVFLLRNETDGVYLTASGENGAYCVSGHTEAETEAARFSPAADGSLTIRGLEDDAYILTEIATDEGYKLLPDAISFTVTASDAPDRCRLCGAAQLTATAKLGDLTAAMGADGESAAAFVDLAITNDPIETIPLTGENGMIFVIGAAALASLCALLLLTARRKRRA